MSKAFKWAAALHGCVFIVLIIGTFTSSRPAIRLPEPSFTLSNAPEVKAVAPAPVRKVIEKTKAVKKPSGPKKVSYKDFAQKNAKKLKASESKERKKAQAVQKAQVNAASAAISSVYKDTAKSLKQSFTGQVSKLSLKGDNALNSSELAAYQARLRQVIDAAWDLPADSAGYQQPAKLRFSVEGSGQLSEILLSQASGSSGFDGSIKQALAMLNAPIPPKGRRYTFEMSFKKQ